MPIHTGSDSQGTYIQWGGHGKKYYYGSGSGMTMSEARSAAGRQAAAAYAHGYRGR
jgi:hypothetical protein